MDCSPLRRRRARPASSTQKVILCACTCLVGLGTQTIAPAVAWRPSFVNPQTAGRGGGRATTTVWLTRVAPTTTTKTATLSGTLSASLHKSTTSTRAESSRFGHDVSTLHGATAIGSSSRRPGGAVLRASSRRGSRAATVMMAAAGEGKGGAEGGADGNNTVLGALAVAGLGVLYYGMHEHGGGTHASLESVVETARAGPSAATTALQTFLTSSVGRVEELGPLGPLYFGALYVLAEVLIIPAIPLTTAAGFLFGVAGGTAIVLTSATIAAGISFQLGRTFLREQVEGALAEYPKFRSIDKAIGAEGFKIILLLRLSPIFPFALSNYLYGVTSVDFWEYMAGTLIGFFPGTLAYVYGGTLGKALSDGGHMDLPWYGYVVGAVFVGLLLKTVGDIATAAVEDMEPSLRDEQPYE